MSNLGKVWLLLVACLPTAVTGQQYSHYTMYMANNFVLNPALAGVESYTDLKLAVRSQWTGITDAPKTVYATVNSPLNAQHAKKNRIGIGGKVILDQTGPISLASAEVSGAYHLRLNAMYRLSFGVGAGINYHRLSIQKLQLRDPADPIYSQGDFGQLVPTVSAGLWFYSNDLYVGISAQNLLENSMEFSVADDLRMPMQQHYFATAGYRFRFGSFYLTPSAMVKFVHPAPVGYDVNVKGQFSDVFWTGVTWRYRDGVAAMAGFFISPTLNVAYAYDFVNSDLRRHSQGSHEIILGININNQWGPKCPTIVW